ncbi:MAG: abortive infection family protein [Anaerobacillus sp.]|uniref:abortive infection family protein n=1 Tax=Anaerobacillus sp. TaxID=1872506 RepID=UPI00391975B2
MNTTVTYLEEFRDSLVKVVNYYWEQRFLDSYNVKESNKILHPIEYKEARRMLLLFYKKNNLTVPLMFSKNRELIDFLEFYMIELMDNTMEVKDIREQLNYVIDEIESENILLQIIFVQAELPDVLTHDYILTEIRRGEQRIEQNDYAGAITSSKTLVESVIKELLMKFEPENKEQIDNYDLLKLYKRLKKHLNMDKVEIKSGVASEGESASKKYEESLNQILRGFNSVIQGLAEIRNLSGDSHLPTVKASRHHAVMAVNSSITICNFLFHTYKYQQEAKQKIT